MWSDLVLVFADVHNIVAGVCLLIGIILCGIECFIPGFGFFGITGTSLLVFSLVYRLIVGGSFVQFVYMLCIIVVVLSLLVIIAIRSARFGLLSKSGLVQNNSALPIDYASDEKNFAFLLGKEGLTLTNCKPIGKIEVDKLEYEALTNGEFIVKGTKIKVVEVDGRTIVVKKI